MSIESLVNDAIFQKDKLSEKKLQAEKLVDQKITYRAINIQPFDTAIKVKYVTLLKLNRGKSLAK